MSHREEKEEIANAAKLDQFRAHPHFQEFLDHIDARAADALKMLLNCPRDEVLETRGYVRALLTIEEDLDARIHEGRDLAARLRREAKEARERHREDIERQLERGNYEASTATDG